MWSMKGVLRPVLVVSLEELDDYSNGMPASVLFSSTLDQNLSCTITVLCQNCLYIAREEREVLGNVKIFLGVFFQSK